MVDMSITDNAPIVLILAKHAILLLNVHHVHKTFICLNHLVFLLVQLVPMPINLIPNVPYVPKHVPHAKMLMFVPLALQGI